MTGLPSSAGGNKGRKDGHAALHFGGISTNGITRGASGALQSAFSCTTRERATRRMMWLSLT